MSLKSSILEDHLVTICDDRQIGVHPRPPLCCFDCREALLLLLTLFQESPNDHVQVLRSRFFGIMHHSCRGSITTSIVHGMSSTREIETFTSIGNGWYPRK